MSLVLVEKKKIIKTILVLVSLLIVSISGFSYGKHFGLPSLSSFFVEKKQDIPQFDKKNFEENILPSFSAKKFSQEELKQYKERLRSFTRSEDPRKALLELREAATKGKVGKDCHVLTHEIGYSAYERYRDPVKALEYKEQVCGYGYIHGVIESYVEDTPNPLETMEGVCEQYTAEREKLECYHALGHAYMIYSGNDLPFALLSCGRYSDKLFQSICGQGVFMENFSADEDHKSDFIRPEDPFYPCMDQEDVFKPDCYKMAPLYYLYVHNDNFKDILQWCQNAPGVYSYWCVRGAGLQLMQYSLDMEVYEQFCLSGTEKQVRPCIEEMVRNTLLYHPEKMESICKKGLKYPYTKEVCSQITKERTTQYLK